MFLTGPIVWLQSWASPGLTRTMEVISWFGYTRTAIAFAVFIAFAFRLRAGMVNAHGVDQQMIRDRVRLNPRMKHRHDFIGTYVAEFSLPEKYTKPVIGLYDIGAQLCAPAAPGQIRIEFVVYRAPGASIGRPFLSSPIDQVMRFTKGLPEMNLPVMRSIT